MAEKPISLEDIYNLITNSNTELKGEIEQLNKNITEVKKEIENTNNKFKEIEEENKTLKNKLNVLEAKLKKYSVVAYGINEEDKGAAEEAKEFIEQKLEIFIETTQIRDSYRIGRKVENQKKPRPLVIELLNYRTKQNILIKSKQLPRGSGVFVTNDYTKEEYEKRKVLHAHLKQARQANNSAYIKNNKLYVNGDAYSYETLQQDELPETFTVEATSKFETGHRSTNNNSETKRGEKRSAEEASSGKQKILVIHQGPKLRSNSRP
ncbi:unnamed protein product [Acanthoscelides obtectus]|uniref:Endonuclease-reverse transcriptase n=1 Tax=Acanthoscelides obtectus TaxID=200917 RepID=A0A9P0JT31_ACAOB|nr:unnamed protein product [Acanthoscelides obtectus]CAK1647932.1 hypothetical protein AOBTE_LOCUS15461 [Acanthoscelides obtectus]